MHQRTGGIPLPDGRGSDATGRFEVEDFAGAGCYNSEMGKTPAHSAATVLVSVPISGTVISITSPG